MRRLTRRQRWGAAVLAALAVGFLALDVSGGELRTAHSGVRGALGSLYRGTDVVLGPARRFAQGVPSAGTNHSRISALQRENAVLQGKLAATQAERATHDLLDRLQLAADHGGYRILPARVVALGPGGDFDWTVTLDAGSADGILVDQTVTDGAGLVGRVLHANAASCVVLLGADPGSGIGVRDLRSGQVGVVTGHGSDGFTFVALDPNAVVQVGDRLATGPGGQSGYVSGLAVGTVASVRSGPDGSTRVAVRPAVSPTGLDVVGVILVGGAPEVSRPPLIPSSRPSDLGAPR